MAQFSLHIVQLFQLSTWEHEHRFLSPILCRQLWPSRAVEAPVSPAERDWWRRHLHYTVWPVCSSDTFYADHRLQHVHLQQWGRGETEHYSWCLTVTYVILSTEKGGRIQHTNILWCVICVISKIYIRVCYSCSSSSMSIVHNPKEDVRLWSIPANCIQVRIWSCVWLTSGCFRACRGRDFWLIQLFCRCRIGVHRGVLFPVPGQEIMYGRFNVRPKRVVQFRIHHLSNDPLHARFQHARSKQRSTRHVETHSKR